MPFLPPKKKLGLNCKHLKTLGLQLTADNKETIVCVFGIVTPR